MKMNTFKEFKQESFVDKKDIRELIDLLEERGLRKLVLKEKDFEIHLEKDGYVPPAPPVHSHPKPNSEPHLVPHDKPEARAEGGHYVESPMVGTFYSAAAPDQPDFVKIGDQVAEDSTICIIEAMKVMNEVKAGKSGTVAEILLGSADPVEFGTKLFRIV